MKSIETVLVANRGEIARRIFRTCRDLGCATAAVYSEADRDLPFVREADRAWCIGPPPAAESYLAVESLLDAARRSGADAVHPGYGFLAENAAFARAVRESGLVWIGPGPEAIAAMGDKAAARALAEQHEVSTVPGYNGEDQAEAAFVEAAARIGYPVLVKAAAGGGGRGMRRVERADDLPEALAGARREAEGAFGDGTLLIERYLGRPRHIEVQVLADSHAGAVYLFERECSIQRRHQKIIEEAPSPGVSPELRRQLGEAALRVARAVGYENAGTVEFLVDEQGRFYFLEMNTRLQVEHPVTELVTGLDLVALQFAVAEGRPLPFAQEDLHLRGHAIEARLYAEDPVRDYLPSSGPLYRFDLGDGEGIRVDAGYERGCAVGVHYDPMLAKVLSWGGDRSASTRRMRRALREAWVPGVATNLPLLREIFAHDAWAAGDLDTHFLERHGLPTIPPLNLERGAVAATTYAWARRGRDAPWHPEVPAGWRLEGPAQCQDRWHSLAEEVTITWSTVGPDELAISVASGGEDTQHRVRVLSHEGDELRVEIDGSCERWRVIHRDARGGPPHGPVEDNDVVYVHLGDAEAVVSLVPRLPIPHLEMDEPGTCSAPMPGKIASLQVAVGDPVTKGQTLLVLEAMKMEHAIAAPSDGTITEIPVQVGDSVDQGAVLIRLEESDAAE